MSLLAAPFSLLLCKLVCVLFVVGSLLPLSFHHIIILLRTFYAIARLDAIALSIYANHIIFFMLCIIARNFFPYLSIIELNSCLWSN